MTKKKRLEVLNSLKTDLLYINNRIRSVEEHLDKGYDNFSYDVTEIGNSLGELRFIEMKAKKFNVYYEIKRFIEEYRNFANKVLNSVAEFKINIKNDLTEKE